MTRERHPERNAEIRRLRSEGWKLEAIAAQFNISLGNVWAVLNPDKHAASERRRSIRSRPPTTGQGAAS